MGIVESNKVDFIVIQIHGFAKRWQLKCMFRQSSKFTSSHLGSTLIFVYGELHPFYSERGVL